MKKSGYNFLNIFSIQLHMEQAFSMMTDLSGEYLGNNLYQLKSLLREGFLSDVYVATDINAGREVAIKMIKEEYAADVDMCALFTHAAKTATRLSHRHILPVYMFGHDKRLNRPFIVMQLVRETLRDYMGAPMKLPEVADFLKMIADGLAFVHKNGEAHNDIRPGNILVDTGKFIYLTDFSVPYLPVDPSVEIPLHTAYYISPERFQTDPPIANHCQIDIYALGVVVYEMITGLPPFRGDTTAEVIFAHLKNEVPAMDSVQPGLNVPSRVEKVVSRALEKNPKKRWSLVSEFSSAFYSAVQQSATEASVEWSARLTHLDRDSEADSFIHAPDGFVDRKAEWKTILYYLSAIKNGTSPENSIIQINGMAGIGKSWLIDAAVHACNGMKIPYARVNLENIKSDEGVLNLIDRLVQQMSASVAVPPELSRKISTVRSLLSPNLRQRIPWAALEKDQAELQKQFINYFRTVLIAGPFVIMMDNCERLKRTGLESFLRELYESSKFSQGFILILASRRKLSLETPVKQIQDLGPFERPDTVEQWCKIAPPPFASQDLGEFVHDGLSGGHPGTNLRVAQRVERYKREHPGPPQDIEPTEALSSLWPSITEELANAMLDDLLGQGDGSGQWKDLSRNLAALRIFNRKLALEMLRRQALWLIPSQENLLIWMEEAIGRLIDAQVIIPDLNHRPFNRTIASPLRRFIMDDLYLNHSQQFTQTHKNALESILQLLVGEESQPTALLIREALYHEAMILKPLSASSAELHENSTKYGDIQYLTSRLESCLSNFAQRDPDHYPALYEYLLDLLRSETEIPGLVREMPYRALLSRLAELDSVDKFSPPSPTQPTPQPVPEVYLQSQAPHPLDVPSRTLNADKALRIVGGLVLIQIILFLVILFAVTLSGMGGLNQVIVIYLTLVFLQVVVFLTLIGILGAEDTRDLLTKIIGFPSALIKKDTDKPQTVEGEQGKSTGPSARRKTLGNNLEKNLEKAGAELPQDSNSVEGIQYAEKSIKKDNHASIPASDETDGYPPSKKRS